MLYDKLEHLGRYTKLHPNLALAADLLAKVDQSQLQLGRNELAGDDVFLMSQANQTVQAGALPYEYHKRYADVHIVTSGQEIMRYGLGQETEHQAYDSENDFGLVTCENQLDVVLKPGYFALFLPEEPHCPNIAVDEPEQITKLVLKVLMG